MHVVDTNVAIVANGRPQTGESQVSPSCRLAAVIFLEELLENGQIALDVEGLIQEEYHRYLNTSGQPGVGDRFYLAVLHSSPTRIHRENLARNADGEFEDFPESTDLRTFDISDRKFAALARKLKVPIANAVDSDWVSHKQALAIHGIVVEFVCGEVCESWFF